jgi:hypothetical protein
VHVLDNPHVLGCTVDTESESGYIRSVVEDLGNSICIETAISLVNESVEVQSEASACIVFRTFALRPNVNLPAERHLPHIMKQAHALHNQTFKSLRASSNTEQVTLTSRQDSLQVMPQSIISIDEHNDHPRSCLPSTPKLVSSPADNNITSHVYLARLNDHEGTSTAPFHCGGIHRDRRSRAQPRSS